MLGHACGMALRRSSLGNWTNWLGYPGYMPGPDVIMWHAIGTVAETINQEGRKGKLFWKIIVKTDSGFNCLYVRKAELLAVAERLVVGQKIEAAGEISAQSDAVNASKPVFLTATQLIAHK